jgi:hypothetical protein
MNALLSLLDWASSHFDDWWIRVRRVLQIDAERQIPDTNIL